MPTKLNEDETYDGLEPDGRLDDCDSMLIHYAAQFVLATKSESSTSRDVRQAFTRPTAYRSPGDAEEPRANPAVLEGKLTSPSRMER